MKFRIKFTWFNLHFNVLAAGDSIRILTKNTSSEVEQSWTWVDDSQWSVSAKLDRSPIVVKRNDVIVAEGIQPNEGFIPDIQWTIFDATHAETVTFSSHWVRCRRIDRVYGKRGNVIMQARWAWGAVDVTVSDAWCDILPLFVAFCTARRPSSD